jgi:hypothetical protein
VASFAKQSWGGAFGGGVPAFKVLPAPGGVYHVYPDGRKVYVRAGASAAAAPAAVSPGQAQQAAAVALAPDSTYITNTAQSTAAVANQLAANDVQGLTNQANYQEALRRLQTQRPKDEQTTKETANSQGLFYGGALSSRLDDLATRYARSQGDLANSFHTTENARLAARAAIQAGQPIDDAAQQAALADRTIGNDTDAADSGALAPPDQQVTPAAPAAPVARTVRAPRKPKYKTVTARGNVFHTYSSGRRVAVRPVSRT